MPSTPVDYQNEELREAYRQAEHRLRIRHTKVACILTLVLVPAGCSLDYFVYPELLWPLLEIRLICSLLVLPILLLLYTPIGRRYIRLWTFIWFIIPVLAMAWMVRLAGDPLSPYYAGLNLIIFGTCQLLPFTLIEASLYCLTAAGAYVAVSLLPGAADVPAAILFNNTYFIVLTAVISVTACHFSTARWKDDFRLRYELDLRNAELERTLVQLREAEAQLIQSEKMNALGSLAAGLLHEINNPLNYTMTAVQLAQLSAEDKGDEDLDDTLRDIDEGMKRIRDIVSGLRTFAYPEQAENAQRLQMTDAVETAMRFTAHVRNGQVIERELVPDGTVLASKTHITQVLVNLLTNALRAVEAVKSERTPRVRVSTERAGDRLRVKVWDNGVGIDPETLPRIFDPFFTTADVGEGTGLGLSICHTIIKNHGGTIQVRSEKDQWTEVEFDLPSAGHASACPTSRITEDTS